MCWSGLVCFGVVWGCFHGVSTEFRPFRHFFFFFFFFLVVVVVVVIDRQYRSV